MHKSLEPRRTDTSRILLVVNANIGTIRRKRSGQLARDHKLISCMIGNRTFLTNLTQTDGMNQSLEPAQTDATGMLRNRAGRLSMKLMLEAVEIFLCVVTKNKM